MSYAITSQWREIQQVFRVLLPMTKPPEWKGRPTPGQAHCPSPAGRTRQNPRKRLVFLWEINLRWTKKVTWLLQTALTAVAEKFAFVFFFGCGFTVQTRGQTRIEHNFLFPTSKESTQLISQLWNLQKEKMKLALLQCTPEKKRGKAKRKIWAVKNYIYS